MFNHILIPLDGSKLAESAIKPAIFLVEKLGGKTITLMHIIEKNPPLKIHGEYHLKTPAEAESYLREIAQKRFPQQTKINYHVHTSEVKDVAKSIAEHEGELGTDLIAMCTHGKGGMRDLLFGSIAQQVISSSKKPILVIHPDEPEKTAAFACKKILLPLDGSEAHEKGISLAKNMAKACNSSISLLVVVNTFHSLSGQWAPTSRLLPGTTHQLLDMKSEDAGQYLTQISAQLEDAKIATRFDVKRGNPAKIIANVAKSRNIDLIILATHGKAGFNAFWAASVAPKICKHCHIPLLLVPVIEEA
jgi:nucleotide-binding universal stress UspA family protein